MIARGAGAAGSAGVAQPPIGVFDSGVGGLTVLRALVDALPDRDFVYLGDTARLPYGTKSAETVERYSLQCAAALDRRGIGRLVVACNTASACALGALRARYPAQPISGVIEPGAAAAVAASESGHIAIIATEGTISGGAYQQAIVRLDPRARVTARACGVFVALAEEGWTTGPVVEAAARRYLEPMFMAPRPPDTLVLGCTHFPVLRETLRAVLPPTVRIVDSAATTAALLEQELRGDTERRPAPRPAGAIARGRITWLATDGAERFARVGGRFFGAELRPESVEIVDL